jgi:hypothetical protein
MEERYLAPHRGVMILVFGILGLVACGIFGLLAWIFGNADLAEMDAGRMDPSGRDLTNVGRILGMIVCLLWIVGLIVGFMVVVVGGVAAAS